MFVSPYFTISPEYNNVNGFTAFNIDPYDNGFCPVESQTAYELKVLFEVTIGGNKIGIEDQFMTVIVGCVPLDGFYIPVQVDH